MLAFQLNCSRDVCIPMHVDSWIFNDFVELWGWKKIDWWQQYIKQIQFRLLRNNNDEFYIFFGQRTVVIHDRLTPIVGLPYFFLFNKSFSHIWDSLGSLRIDIEEIYKNFLIKKKNSYSKFIVKLISSYHFSMKYLKWQMNKDKEKK